MTLSVDNRFGATVLTGDCTARIECLTIGATVAIGADTLANSVVSNGSASVLTCNATAWITCLTVGATIALWTQALTDAI